MLVDQNEKSSYISVTSALRMHIDTAGKIWAAPGFCHLSQGDKETVAELILRLECTFRIAYGRNNMSAETRDALLYRLLQEGLRQEIMKSLATRKELRMTSLK